MAESSAKIGVQQFVEQCVMHGVKHLVFSPGSRNAPLVIAFGARTDVTTYVIPDERSAAFYALGMAEELVEPVAIACTSGSAVLNYAPAVSEAFYRNIPLVVISADRPSEWTDQGDGQTIRQEKSLSNHVLGETSLLELPTSDDQKWFNQRETDRLLNTCMGQPKGPVHFNFPFSEPLYERTVSQDSFSGMSRQVELEHRLSIDQLDEFRQNWNSMPKKLILCGQMPKDAYLQNQLKQLVADPSVAVVVENTSNLQDRSFVHCIDRTLNSFQLTFPKIFQPDLMITLGGAVISKKVKAFLRTNPPKQHWKVGLSFPFMDTYKCLTHSIRMEPGDFIHTLLGEGFDRNLSRYGEQWKQLDYQIQDKHLDFLQNAPYSDLSVFDLIMDAVPDHAVLHLANSSVVRYAQLFDALGTLTYRCNRGTSGIDGSISTAIGSAIAMPDKLHVIITGDISFFYDSNAFWNNHVPSNIRVFLINNGGGGIFSIIPGPKTTEFADQYFITENNGKAKGICDAFEINYYAADSMLSIDEQLQDFYDWQANKRPAVMEICTPKTENSTILDSYWDSIKISSINELKL